jgi:hypothetical protein
VKILDTRQVAILTKERIEEHYPSLRLPLGVYVFFIKSALKRIEKTVHQDKGRIFLQNCHLRQVYRDLDFEKARAKLIEDGL